MTHRFIVALLLLCTGCTTQVIPPTNPPDPVTVYLTDYGKHSSIILPISTGGFDEYAFGDWEYFAVGHNNLFVGIRALFGSSQPTLGRRHMDARADQLPSLLETEKLSPIVVSSDRVTALSSELDARFRRDSSTPYHSDYSHLDHVPDAENYWGLHNCNHVTAEWLHELDCRIDGTAIFSKFVVKSAK